MTTRSEKLAAARGLLDEAARARHTDIGLAATIDALRLALDLIEASEDALARSMLEEKPASAVVRDEAWWVTIVDELIFISHNEPYNSSVPGKLLAKLRATFGQDPAPSPAPRSPSAAVALDALQSYADGDGATDLRNVAALVAGVKPELYYPPPAPAPAFDVEALADAIARKHYPHGPPCSLDGLRDTVRDVAREMRKEGVR